MKILIIHHLDPHWEVGYNRAGTSFDDLQVKFLKHLNRVKYDKVILTRFDDYRLTEEYFPEFAQKVDKVENYSYGWEKDQVEAEIEECSEKPENWAEGGNHSDMVWLAPFIRKLKDEDVTISGAFDGECLEDLEIALKACGVKYKRNEKLIIKSC